MSKTTLAFEIVPGLPVQERVASNGSGGWSVDIFRYITYPDGTQTTEKWTWHYSGAYRVIEQHPCVRAGTNTGPCAEEEDP